MRIALLSDIHANLPALEAAAAAAEREGADLWLSPGDLVGYGASPNECAARASARFSFVTAGNHDRIAIGRLGDDRCIRLARESLRWTARVLTPDVRRYLETLPLRAEPGAGIVMAHGSLDDPRDYIVRPEQARAQLLRLAELRPDARLLVLGHTHHRFAYSLRRGVLPVPPDGTLRLPAGDMLLLNPGAVGQSRDRRPLARFAILDLDRFEVLFREVPYDVAACREALRRAGLPADSCHRKPSAARDLARLARRLIARAGSPIGS